MIYKIYIFLILAAICACETEDNEVKDYFSIIDPSESEIINEIDSLMLSLQVERAKERLVYYNSQSLTETETTYVNSKLWRCKLHYSWMFEKDEFPDLDTNRILPIDSFYFEFYRKGDFDRIESVKQKWTSSDNLNEKLDYGLQLSTYLYYLSKTGKHPESKRLTRQIYEQIESIQFNTIHHLDLYHMMINLSSYSRKNLRSLVLCDKFLDELRHIAPISNPVKLRIINQKILTYIRLNDIEQAVNIVTEVENNFDSKTCIPENQTFYKNAIYAHLYENRENQKYTSQEAIYKYDSLFVKHVEDCQIDHANYARVKAQTYSENGEINQSVRWWKKAYEYFNDQAIGRISVYNTIVWFYSQALERTKQFEQAIKIYSSKRIKTDAESIHNQLNSFSFIDKARLASIRINQWKQTEEEPKALREAHNLLEEAYSLFFSQTVSINEDAILRIYDNKEILIESALDFYYQLYQKSPRKRNLDSFYKFTSIKKNMLLDRDMNLFISDSLINKRLRIEKSNIDKLIKSIDHRDISHWEEIQSLLDLQDSLEVKIITKYNDAGIQLNRTKSRIHIDDIQRELSVNQSFLDYIILQDHLYICVINKEDVFIYKKEAGSLSDLISELYKIQSQNQTVSTKIYQSIAHEIYNILIGEDIKSKLRQQLFISPDQSIHQVSFAALVSEINSQANNFKDVNYLIKDYKIRYKLLPNGFSQREPTKDSRIVAFSYSSPETILESRDIAMHELPYAYQEVQKLREKYPETNIFAGKTATKEQFINSLTADDVDIIHLGVHGYSSGYSRDDIKLYFRTEQGELDSLYGYELLGLESSVNKIIINACDSGSGKIEQGEGLYSLTRYFQQIGIKEQTSHLWKIDSKTSTIDISDKLTHDTYSHPYFWASLLNY